MLTNDCAKGPLIDFEANNVKVPVNVLGLQTENVDALNRMFSGNKGSNTNSFRPF